MRTLLVLLALAGAAYAQRTGGRMGGGSWSTPSHSSPSPSPSPSASSTWSSSPSSSSHSWSSSSSSHSWSSTPSSPSSSSSSSSYSSSTSPSYEYHEPLFRLNGTFWLIAGSIVTLIILLMILWPRGRSFSGELPVVGDIDFGPPASQLLADKADVTVLRVVIDGRARKLIQTELGKISRSCDTGTPDGRLAMLRQVTLLLRRLRDAWVYGGAHNEPVSALGKAKSLFDAHVDEARTRFEHETVSNVQGAKSEAPSPGFAPRGDEGEGLILVSIVIAARTELFTVTRVGDGEELRKALEAASNLATDQLVAVEVVWMPSEEGDRMSSLELEAKYPRPAVIPIQGALVGKTFCAYCGGPFPDELVSCPHCGAPNKHAA